MPLTGDPHFEISDSERRRLAAEAHRRVAQDPEVALLLDAVYVFIDGDENFIPRETRPGESVTVFSPAEVWTRLDEAARRLVQRESRLEPRVDELLNAVMDIGISDEALVPEMIDGEQFLS